MAATKKVIDFSDVRDASDVNSRHMKPGEYRARIVKVDDSPAKDGTDQWRFVIKLTDHASTYAYYCKIQENQLWKLRNLCLSCGIAVPKKRLAVDPNRLVGKILGVVLEDNEYKDKLRSQITEVMPASELTESQDPEGPDDEDEDEDDEEETPRARSSKPAAPADDEDEEGVSEDDLESLDIDDV